MTSVITDNELRKALRKQAESMNVDTARYLVDAYYQMQNERIAMQGRERAEIQGVDNNPGQFMGVMVDFFLGAEAEIAGWLDKYSANDPLGQWARSQKGIGPVLAAGLLAHIDIERSNSVSQVWSFAGLNPAMVWEKGQKRPFNAKLKTLCWKIGESFIKVKSRDGAFYGQLFDQRKQREWRKNIAGEFAHLKGTPRYKYGPTTESYKWMNGFMVPVEQDGVFGATEIKNAKKMTEEERLAAGGVIMIPPQAIHGRSRRYAVKMFLSHYWQVGYELRYGKPAPNVYVIEHGGHVDKIDPPNYEPLAA